MPSHREREQMRAAARDQREAAREERTAMARAMVMRKMTFDEIGRHFGVSDSAVRQWLGRKHEGLNERPHPRQLMSDEKIRTMYAGRRYGGRG